MVEQIEEAKQLKATSLKTEPKLLTHNLLDIDKATSKQIIKKCYPQTSFNPLDHPFTCSPNENQVHCHLYALSFSTELNALVSENISSDCSLGFVYWNDTLDQMRLDLDLDSTAHATLEYLCGMRITLEQYKTFIMIDRFFTASVRSWDVNFFELLFQEYPVMEKSSLIKKFRELENIYLPPILSWNDVKYSFFLALNKNKEPDLQRAKQILDHLAFMLPYYLHFRVPDNHESEEEDVDIEKLKVDEKFVNEFKADPAKLTATTVVQNLTNFNKLLIAKAAPLTKVDLLTMKLGKHTMQSRAIFYLEKHFDYPINKDEYILHLKSYSKRLSYIIKGGKTNAKDRRKADANYEFYSFLSELRPYPININLSLQILLAERTITQIRDNQRVLHFRENILKPLENGIMHQLNQRQVSYEIQIHQSVNKLIQKALLVEETVRMERNLYTKSERHILDDSNIYYTEKINMEILKTALSGVAYNLNQNYENLEFLGDTILKLLSSIEVFVLNPSDTEEGLTDKRKAIISNAFLCEKAVKYRFYEYMLLKNDGPTPPEALSYKKTLVQDFNNHEVVPDHYQHIPDKTLADVLEALTGVYYLQNDRLLEAAQRFLFMIGVLQLPRMYPRFINEGAQSRSILKSNIEFNRLEELINYRFESPSLLLQATTHSSANTSSGDIQVTRLLTNNESPAHFSYDRLELLGDAVIDFIVVDYIFQKYTQLDPGILSLMKIAAVSNQTLAMISLKHGFDKHLWNGIQDFHKQAETLRHELSERKEHTIHNEKGPVKTLADVFEALIGAVFVDCKFNYRRTIEVFMGLAQETVDNLLQYQYAEYSKSKKFKNRAPISLFCIFTARNCCIISIIMFFLSKCDFSNVILGLLIY